MKSIYKISFLLLIIVGVVGLISSCKKDHNSPTPSITYVRVTNPQSADSLLIGAGQGALIAIVGNDLQDVVQIWFNDQQSVLTPSYITSTSIIVRVPSQIPQKVTDTMKLIFSNGYILNYKFKVQISNL
jgi:hypothetical protein